MKEGIIILNSWGSENKKMSNKFPIKLITHSLFLRRTQHNHNQIFALRL